MPNDNYDNNHTITNSLKVVPDTGLGQFIMKMKTLLFISVLLPLSCFGQHVIMTKDGRQINCQITQIGDSAILYQLPSKGKSKDVNAQTYELSMDKVFRYQLLDGVFRLISPNPIPQKDTIVSIVKSEENLELLQQYMQNQNNAIGHALKKTGTISMAIGAPCLAAGVACLIYANCLPNPVDGYTTSKQQAQTNGSTYITVEEYNAKVKDFNRKTHNAEVAGYVMTPLGGALTIVGIPLYVSGNKMLKLNLQISNNGAGVAVNF